jgi:transcriptional regulator with GAF, ATPase, and Fis domain
LYHRLKEFRISIPPLRERDGDLQNTIAKLKSILDETGWNRREAARRLGVSKGTIRNWIKKYSLS